jgi:Tat protein translocase TatB subunit
MLDFGWSEFFLILVLVLVLMGPRDLPGLVYQVGRLVRRAQYWRFAVTKQFDSFMEQNDLAELRRGGGLADLKGDVRAALQVPPPGMGRDDGIEDEEDELAFHESESDARPVTPAQAGGQKNITKGSQLSLGLPLEPGEGK